MSDKQSRIFSRLLSEEGVTVSQVLQDHPVDDPHTVPISIFFMGEGSPEWAERFPESELEEKGIVCSRDDEGLQQVPDMDEPPAPRMTFHVYGESLGLFEAFIEETGLSRFTIALEPSLHVAPSIYFPYAQIYHAKQLASFTGELWGRALRNEDLFEGLTIGEVYKRSYAYAVGKNQWANPVIERKQLVPLYNIRNGRIEGYNHVSVRGEIIPFYWGVSPTGVTTVIIKRQEQEYKNAGADDLELDGFIVGSAFRLETTIKDMLTGRVAANAPVVEDGKITFTVPRIEVQTNKGYNIQEAIVFCQVMQNVAHPHDVLEACSGLWNQALGNTTYLDRQTWRDNKKEPDLKPVDPTPTVFGVSPVTRGFISPPLRLAYEEETVGGYAYRSDNDGALKWLNDQWEETTPPEYWAYAN
jgi:hypothetical protein